MKTTFNRILIAILIAICIGFVNIAFSVGTQQALTTIQHEVAK